MLQSLLKERFKVTLHREKKDHAIYALVVGKSGPKLKVAEVSAIEPGAPKVWGSGKSARAAAARRLFANCHDRPRIRRPRGFAARRQFRCEWDRTADISKRNQ